MKRRFDRWGADVGTAAASTPAMIETSSPARTPEIAADVAVPILQAVFSGVVGGLVGLVIAWRSGGDLALWAVGGFVAALAVAWLIALGLVRNLLWHVERITAADLDGDGRAGQPEPETHVMVENPQAARATVAKLEASKRTAEAVRDYLDFWQRCHLVGTASRAHGAKPGTLGMAAYEAKRDKLMKLGLAAWKNDANHNAGWSVTTDLAMGAQIITAHLRELRVRPG